MLSVPGKLLFLYCITNPHTHLSGIYYLPKILIQKETGISDRVCDTLLDTLSASGLAQYDQESETIFIPQMFKYQGRGEKNERAAALHLASLHHSSLILTFLTLYPNVKTHLSDRVLDRVSDTPSQTRPPVPSPSSVPSLPDPEKSVHSKKEGNGVARAQVLPVDFTFDQRAEELAKGFGLNPHKEFAAFKDHAAAKGRICKDWQAAFRNWLRNSVKFKEVRR